LVLVELLDLQVETLVELVERHHSLIILLQAELVDLQMLSQELVELEVQVVETVELVLLFALVVEMEMLVALGHKAV
jgi:hypothetical protein